MDESPLARGTTGPETNATERSGSGVEEIETEEPTVGLDQIFGVLQNRRRRDVLRHLREVEGVTRSELAEEIAARECDKDVRQLESQERKRAYVGLYQSHLPRLAAVNAITYDQDRGTIERGAQFDLFIDYLPTEITTDNDRATGSRWKQYVTRLLN